jgi:RNA polymerase sigma-70 factor (ECF subfamily)
MNMMAQDNNVIQTNLAEMTDDELVQLFQERGMLDERPFKELYQRHCNLVWQVCYNAFNNFQDAEDMTQEVFLKVHRSLNRFQRRSSFKTWIYRITINACRNEIRRRSRRPQEAATDVDMLAEVLPSRATTVSDWETQALREKLAQGLSELRPEEFEILRLKDLEERPYNEITAHLGISLSAAKMRVLRARQSLRGTYQWQTIEEFVP